MILKVLTDEYHEYPEYCCESDLVLYSVHFLWDILPQKMVVILVHFHGVTTLQTSKSIEAYYTIYE